VAVLGSVAGDQPRRIGAAEQDSFGTTGTVDLLPRGTKVFGEYRNEMRPGQDRIFVAWDRAETPDHVLINLGSPRADSLGRSGFDGRRRGTIWAVQASLQPMEARTASREQATSLPERLQRTRINRALQSRMPGLAERLRRHGENFRRLARAGSVLAERLASLARAKRAVGQNEQEYWQEVAARASPTSEQAQIRTRRHGHRR
jgi:hypothetical protein